MKILISALLLLCCIPGQSQVPEKYRIMLVPASFRFYCGIVNDAIFPIDDAHQPKRSFQFKAIANGAQLDYDDAGRMSILPDRKEFTFTVYAAMKNQLYRVDQLTAWCIDPPLDDADFKMIVPHPEKALKKVNDFSIQGKSIKEDSSLTINYSSGMTDQLTESEESMVALSVYKIENNSYNQIPWQDCEIKSADAVIKRDRKQIYTITSNPGVRKCVLEVFVRGSQVDKLELRVKRKGEPKVH